MKNKKGASWIVLVLVALIIVVLVALFMNFFRYYNEAKQLKKNLETREIDYYLPANFAVVKIARGSWDAKIEGIKIFFTDQKGRKHYYETNDYPSTLDEKQYVILKDELQPVVADDWDFSKVTQISFAFLLPEGRISREIYSIKLNPEKVSGNFGSKCFFADETGNGSNVLCD